MRASVVFVAVFAVSSCSVGVSGAYFVKSGPMGGGTRRGDAPGIGESALVAGENGGHRVGKRSIYDIARLAAYRSAAAKRHQMNDSNATYPVPVLLPVYVRPPTGPVYFPPPPYEPPIVEVPPWHPITKPPPLPGSWGYPPLVKPHIPKSMRAVPGVLEREVRYLPALKYLPLSEIRDEPIKIVPEVLPDTPILPVYPSEPSVGRSFARSQDFYRSYLKHLGSRYSGFRSYPPVRSHPSLRDLLYGVAPAPLYKNVRNTAPYRSLGEENLRQELRFGFIKYLVQLWHKITNWFIPSSGAAAVAAAADGNEPARSLPPETHTEPPPEEEQDDVVIVPVTQPTEDDDAQIIHLSSEEEVPGKAKDPAVVSNVGKVYPSQEELSNWELRERSNDGLFDDDDYKPVRNGRMDLAESMHYSNWEARDDEGMEDGLEDVGSKIEDALAGTRREDDEDLDILTDIFG